jgi:hypothetical protein
MDRALEMPEHEVLSVVERLAHSPFALAFEMRERHGTVFRRPVLRVRGRAQSSYQDERSHDRSLNPARRDFYGSPQP